MIYYIAEVGLAHDGSLGIAHSYIDALANIGVNAVKFQMHLAEHESSDFEKFRVNFSYEDKSRFDYWKRTSFTLEQWIGLKNHCDELNLDFIVSPFSIKACKSLLDIGMKTFKVGSGELSNFLLLDTINKVGERVILSSGLSDYSDLENAIARFDEIDHKNISILQCTTAYPTKPEQWGLNNISLFKEKFKNIKVGYSDHSGQIFSSLAAISLGAEVIEFHVVFDKLMFGPDSQSSLTISEIKMLVEGGNKIYKSTQSPLNKDDSLDVGLKNIFGKSLAINKNIKKGDILKKSDLETKKPANMGIPANEYKNIINQKVNRDLCNGDFLDYKFFN
jgi:N-acetylneuraminate synthase